MGSWYLKCSKLLLSPSPDLILLFREQSDPERVLRNIGFVADCGEGWGG